MRYPGKIINLFFLPVHDLANLTKNCHHKFEDSVLAKDIMMSTPDSHFSVFRFKDKYLNILHRSLLHKIIFGTIINT